MPHTLSKLTVIATGTIGDKPTIVPTRDIIVIVKIAIARKSVAVTFMARFQSMTQHSRETRLLTIMAF